MSTDSNAVPTYEDHVKALIEIAFLLDIFATTINDLMGGATASISRISGRSMARKLPIYLKNPDIRQTLTAIASQLKGGCEFSAKCENHTASLNFEKCAIRKICETRNIPLNGPLCSLFHYYLDGMINELHSRPVKSRILSAAESCTTHLNTK
ncbi:MAG: hypothetical protein ACOZB3_11750 [Calditrichota bacterium]